MIAGGGGFRVPLVYRALAAGPFSGLVRELVLFDVDPARLDAMEAVLAAMASGPSSTALSSGSWPRVRTTTSRAEALTGTDMVFAAIRPGGTAGRIADERVALQLGLLGQETTGAGGISYALRSIPAMLELAGAMRQLAPDAWLINFTNPAGMVTEALRPILGNRVIGICDSASGLVRRAAKAAGAPLPEGKLDGVGYYGLNHLGWLYRLESRGQNLLPGLLSDARALAGFEEGRLFPQRFLERLGCLPNEYLIYYYDTTKAVEAMLAAKATRGESIHSQQEDLYPRLAAAGPAAYSLWDSARRSREEGYLAEARPAGEERDAEDLNGGGYERVALSVMRALSGGGNAELILNTVNSAGEASAGGNSAGGTSAGHGDAAVPAIPGLPTDAVVEVPCVVNPEGAAPLPQRLPHDAQLSLMLQVKKVERLTVRAATSGDRESAIAAFAEHPLIASETLALALLKGYEEALPALKERWR
jgi:6-phospho-beta-glucosidase